MSLQKLQARHLKVMDLTLEGKTRGDIAEAVGMTPQNVYLVTNSPLFQQELARRREEREKHHDSDSMLMLEQAKDILANNSARAAEVHVGLLDSTSDRIKQASASAILDRVGLSPQKQEESRAQPITVSVEVFNNLQQALVEVKHDGE